VTRGYTATQNGDGTWNVHDVPVFGPLPKGARKNADPIGREWMVQAVAKAKLRAAENYHGPMHVRHTGDAAPKVNAGRFTLTRVGKYTYEGREIDAIFADLTCVPASVYAELRRGALPFRSVEVFDWSEPEINELALLDTDTPFFRFGWDGIGREVPAAERNATKAEACEPTMAFAAVGSGGISLFAFNDPKDDPKDDEKPEPGEKSDEKAAGDKGAKAAGEDDETDDEEDDKPGSSAEKQLAYLRDGLMALLNGLQDTTDKEDAPVDKKDTDKGGDLDKANLTALTGDVAKFAAENAALAAKLTAAESENTKMVARLAALEAKDAERESAKKADALVVKAKGDLAGYNFTAEIEKHVRKLAAQSDADAAVPEFVSLLKSHLRKDPPATFAAAHGRAAYDSDPAEVAPFAAQGLAYLEAARESVAEFSTWKASPRSAGSDMTLATFLAVNVPQKVAKLAGAGA